jgi:hypothetical protein
VHGTRRRLMFMTPVVALTMLAGAPASMAVASQVEGPEVPVIRAALLLRAGAPRASLVVTGR